MYNFLIPILRLLSKTNAQSIRYLKQKLNINAIKILELIGTIKQINPNLICNNHQGSYLLTKPIDWLDASKLKQSLNIHNLNYQIYLFDQIDSTNDYVIKNLHKINNNSLILTEYQSKGRGRQTNTWLSAIACDLTFTICYTFEKNINISVMPLIVALTLQEILKNFGLITTIKWPNDIYFNQKKIAGILIERIPREDCSIIVIGIGIDNIIGFDRNQAIINIVKHLNQYKTSNQLCDFAYFKKKWLENCIHYLKEIKLYRQNQLLFKGKHVDINDAGSIIIELNNKLILVPNNNISLRF